MAKKRTKTIAEIIAEVKRSCIGRTVRIGDPEPNIVRLTNEVSDLRDAIRLVIGMQSGEPWYQVAEREVDGYLKRVRELNATRAAAEAAKGDAK